MKFLTKEIKFMTIYYLQQILKTELKKLMTAVSKIQT